MQANIVIKKDVTPVATKKSENPLLNSNSNLKPEESVAKTQPKLNPFFIEEEE